MIKYVSDNLEYQTLGRCEHPNIVKNRYTGELVEVPCGKCNTCLINKCNSNALSCSLEEISHRYCYFVTLTYADEYVPRMYPTIPHPTYCNFDGSLRPVQLYEFVNADDPTDVLHRGYYKVDEIKALLRKCDMPDQSFTWLDKIDLQLYLKRLRKHASKISSSQIRYFAVGEYGPKHYRAHWHILFYFNCESLAQDFLQIANQCWRYGRVDVSKSRGQASSYLAGYVNSFTCVPSIFTSRKIRPKSYHSFHFGFADYPQNKEEIYEKGLSYFDDKGFILHGNFISPKCQRRLLSYLFPRCINYASSTFDERLRLYCFSKSFDTLFFKHLKGDKRKRIDICYDYFYCHPECYTLRQSSFMDWILSLCTRQGDFLTSKTYFKVFLYKLFYVSDHFLDFCCSGNSSLSIIRLNQIDKFYYQLEQKRLSDFYKGIDEYCNLYDSCNLSVYYSNWDLLYADDDVDDETTYVNNPIYTMLLNRNYVKLKERIKHRELNDANRMFNLI